MRPSEGEVESRSGRIGLIKAALLPLVFIFVLGGSYMFVNNPRRIPAGIILYLVALAVGAILLAKPWIVVAAVAGIIVVSVYLKLKQVYWTK